jgi:Caspase domain
MRPISVSLRILTCFVALLAAALWSGGNAAQAQKRNENRVALVVGDSNYKSVSPLPNPIHDSEDVAAALTRLNFKVKTVQDADYAVFNRELRDFGRLATSADIAVIYFAGHGIEVDGENWLLPTDVELHSDIDAANEAISLKSAMVAVGSAHTLGLVILDACRNNPFESTMQRPAVSRGMTRGLARVDPFENVLVVYAARDGTVASDGNGRNSPFTTALLRHLETPGLEIDFLFRNVRDDVGAATRNEQQPFVYGSLPSEEIYLNPPVASVVAETVRPEDASEIAWTFLKSTGDIATLARFTERFPASPRVAEAKARVVSLQALPVVASGDPGTVYKLTSYVQASDSGFEGAEIAVAKHFARDNPAIEEAWNFVKDTTDHTLIRRFAEQFPTKKRRVVAEARIAALGQAPITPRPIPHRPLLTVDSNIYASAGRDLSVMECYLLGNQDDPSCRLAVERYPEIAGFPDSLEFLQSFCGSIGKGSDCVATVKSNWNFPDPRDAMAPNNSSAPAGPQTQLAAPAGPQTQLAAPAGPQTQLAAPAGPQTQLAAPAGSQTQLAAPAGSQTQLTAAATQTKEVAFDLVRPLPLARSALAPAAYAIIYSAVFSASGANPSSSSSSSGNPPSSSSSGGNPASNNASTGGVLSNPSKSPAGTDYTNPKANSSITSGSKIAKTTHINLKTDAHLSHGAHPSAKLVNGGTTLHASSSPATSTTPSTKLTTTPANTPADVKASHITTDVKAPKIVQNTPTQARVPNVKVDVKVPKVEVKVPNIQIHLPH